MKISSDFLLVKVPLSTKCTTIYCKNKPKDMSFYLTEWELLTGASIDKGLYYCEKCILNI